VLAVAPAGRLGPVDPAQRLDRGVHVRRARVPVAGVGTHLADEHTMHPRPPSSHGHSHSHWRATRGEVLERPGIAIVILVLVLAQTRRPCVV